MQQCLDWFEFLYHCVTLVVSRDRMSIHTFFEHYPILKEGQQSFLLLNQQISPRFLRFQAETCH